MIGNIIDRRTNPYNVKVDAVFEPSWHDNSIKGATRFIEVETRRVSDDCWARRGTTVRDAINYAEKSKRFRVTIYLYDAGTNPLNVDDILWLNHSEFTAPAPAPKRRKARARKR